MGQRVRANRGQSALAWVFSLAFHIAAVVLIFGGLQVSRGLPGSRERVDTRAQASADFPDEMTFQIADDPPPRSVKAVAPVEPVIPPPEPTPASHPAPVVATPPSPATGGTSAEPGATPAFGAAGQKLHPRLHTGRSVVYVIDRSASMGASGKLGQAVACVRLSLRELPEDALFQIVVYHSTADGLSINGNGDLVPASRENIAAADALLRELVAEGSSRHVEGLRKGLAFHPDALFLLTDADDLAGDHVRAITALNRKGTSIHPVLFGTYRDGRSAFEALARQNRGAAHAIATRP